MDKVFVVGAPRSGTTWLQLLLYQHPRISTAQETHLFDWYITKLVYVWEREKRQRVSRKVGISELVSDEQFLGMLRSFTAPVFNSIAAKKQGADLIVEKTPEHVVDWALIHRILPESRFLHVIRDPRGVVASLKRANRTWGGSWAPKSVADGAAMWDRAIAERQELSTTLGDRYREVRYEDLRAEPAKRLQELLVWLGLESDEEWIESAVAACKAGKIIEGDDLVRAPWDMKSEPASFYRDAPVDEWRHELTAREILVIEYMTSKFMNSLGYKILSREPIKKPIEVVFRNAVGRAFAMLAKQIKRRAPWLVSIAEQAVRE